MNDGDAFRPFSAALQRDLAQLSLDDSTWSAIGTSASSQRSILWKAYFEPGFVQLGRQVVMVEDEAHAKQRTAPRQENQVGRVAGVDDIRSLLEEDRMSSQSSQASAAGIPARSRSSPSFKRQRMAYTSSPQVFQAARKSFPFGQMTKLAIRRRNDCLLPDMAVQRNRKVLDHDDAAAKPR